MVHDFGIDGLNHPKPDHEQKHPGKNHHKGYNRKNKPNGDFPAESREKCRERQGRSGFFDLVPDPSDSLDDFNRESFVNFLAECIDENFDDIALRVKINVPDRFQNFCL